MGYCRTGFLHPDGALVGAHYLYSINRAKLEKNSNLNVIYFKIFIYNDLNETRCRYGYPAGEEGSRIVLVILFLAYHNSTSVLKRPLRMCKKETSDKSGVTLLYL